MRKLFNRDNTLLKFTLIIILLLSIYPALLTCIINAQEPTKAPRLTPISMHRAKQWCDSITLHNPEGIYSCPDLRSIVLIKAHRGMTAGRNPGYCDIICIESENINIAPGQVIGYVSPAGTPNTMRLVLYDKINHNGLTNPKEYLAKYHASQGVISYERTKKKLRFQLNPFSLIPKIGRLVRIVNTQIHEPEIPSGMRRIYPIPTESGIGSPLFPKYF